MQKLLLATSLLVLGSSSLAAQSPSPLRLADSVLSGAKKSSLLEWRAMQSGGAQAILQQGSHRYTLQAVARPDELQLTIFTQPGPEFLTCSYFKLGPGVDSLFDMGSVPLPLEKKRASFYRVSDTLPGVYDPQKEHFVASACESAVRSALSFYER